MLPPLTVSTFFWKTLIPLISNLSQAEFAWNYYGTLRNHSLNSTYQLILGDEKKTHLPDTIFDKVLIIDSFHEFSYKKEMLEDISTKLKPTGILCIDETLAKKAVSYTMAAEKEFISTKNLFLF